MECAGARCGGRRYTRTEAGTQLSGQLWSQPSPEMIRHVSQLTVIRVGSPAIRTVRQKGFVRMKKYSHKIGQYIGHQMKARESSRSQSAHFCLQYLTVYIYNYMAVRPRYKRKYRHGGLVAKASAS